MPVVGDPAGMRAAAAQLRFRAERCSMLAADVDQAMTSMTFSGPAADRWRTAVGDQSNRLRTGSVRLAEAADTLLREAAVVEQARLTELLAGEP